MTVRFVIVAEDTLGERFARDLCDRVVTERAVTWLKDLWADAQLRRSQREWLNLRGERGWSSWAEVKRLAEERRIRAHGLGLKAEGARAHKAVAVAARLEPRPDAVFLAHDADREEAGDVRKRMREGACARPEATDSFEVILAVAHPEVEAWVIAGFNPGSNDERERHASEHKRLKFDPVVKPHELTSKREVDERDAKRVARALLGDEHHEDARWEQCWQQTALEILEENGKYAGLKTYLEEVEARVLPLLGDAMPR